MRLAFISTVLHFPLGGADTLWTRAAEVASARGDQLFLSVSTIVAEHPRIAALLAAGASVLIRDPLKAGPTLTTRVMRKLGFTRSPEARLIAALQAFRPDVVIFSQGGTYDLLLHPALTEYLQQARIRYRIIANWQQEHPLLNSADLSFIQRAFVQADAIYFVSTRNGTVTRRHLALPLPNALVIQNPLRWQARDVTPWPDNPVTQLATVSRLDEGKGIQILLPALHAVAPTLPPWRLNIYGQGPLESQLRALTHQLGLSERVHFHGYVKDLRAIWAENHLMISPAIEDGVPMTIPEAMLCQRPVLATCVGGAEDWLIDGQTGFLCPDPSIVQLAQTLTDAFAARERWPAIGLTAAHAAAARYQPDDFRQLINT